MTKKAIIVGSSGLIGSKLLAMLLAQPDYDEVLIIGRKKTKDIINTKVTQMVIDFDRLKDHVESITGDVIFCCLGTTRDKTPDLAEYRKIDHDYPVELAKIALRNGIGQYHLVSSVGANSHSSNFYTKIKGETEDDIKNVGLNNLHIYRPSVLTGHRKTPRKPEWLLIGLMKIINPLLWGPLKKFRSIPALNVAKAMFKQSIKNKTGVFIYASDQIKKLS